jgi:hypothetical protein
LLTPPAGVVVLQFIKIGQQFSTRVDVLSPEFVKELEKLQVKGGGGCDHTNACTSKCMSGVLVESLAKPAVAMHSAGHACKRDIFAAWVAVPLTSSSTCCIGGSTTPTSSSAQTEHSAAAAAAAVMKDNVPPFESSTALRILEENLGGPPSEVFASFDETPIAAASLGQVGAVPGCS